MFDFFKLTDKSNQIGNVELTLMNDFKKDGDMIFWKTDTSGRGFMIAKHVIGGCVSFKTAIIYLASGVQHIECDSAEIANKVLNCIIGICATLYTSGTIGAVKMSAIEEKFENVIEPGKCDGKCENCGVDKDPNFAEFTKLMDGFFEHLKNKMKEDK